MAGGAKKPNDGGGIRSEDLDDILKLKPETASPAPAGKTPPLDKKISLERSWTRNKVLLILTLICLAGGGVLLWKTNSNGTSQKDNKTPATLPSTDIQNPSLNSTPVKTVECRVKKYPEGFKASCPGSSSEPDFKFDNNQNSDNEWLAEIVTISDDIRVRCRVSFPKDDRKIKPGEDGGKSVFPLRPISCEVLGSSK